VHDRHLNQRRIHGRIAEGTPLLQQADPQHGSQLGRRTPTLLARLGYEGLNHGDEGVPGDHRSHLRRERLGLGLLIDGGLLLVKETALLASHETRAGKRS